MHYFLLKSIMRVVFHLHEFFDSDHRMLLKAVVK